ncbi:DUF91 domain-containing protein [bacterium]|nr:DUF91 domain-containing protein [bacterium]
MPLFQLTENKLTRLKPSSLIKERALQRLFEGNLEELLGIRFVASEYGTGEKHGGRIDTLGLDDNNCPVIIEYKLASKDNIINQGLFYLDWLMDHRGDFEIAVQKKLGSDAKVSWDYTRLILIAQEFSRYDRHAVEQIDRAIELKSYRFYEKGLLYLEDVYSSHLPKARKTTDKSTAGEKKEAAAYSIEDHLAGKPKGIKDLFNELRELLLSFGDNVIEKSLKVYIGYSTTRNFCEIELQKKQLKTFLDIPYSELSEYDIVRNVTNVGHYGTGDCQLIIKPGDELQPVLDLIKQSYDYFQ